MNKKFNIKEWRDAHLKESVNEGGKINLKTPHLSSAEYQGAKKLKAFDSNDWIWNSTTSLYDRVEEWVVNESLDENFPGPGETVDAKDLDYDMLDYFSRTNKVLSIDTKSKKGIKGSVGKMYNDLVFNGDSIAKKDIVRVKILEGKMPKKYIGNDDMKKFNIKEWKDKFLNEAARIVLINPTHSNNFIKTVIYSGPNRDADKEVEKLNAKLPKSQKENGFYWKIITFESVNEGKTSAVYTDPKTGKGYDLQYVSSKKRWELDIMKKGASIYSNAITTIKRNTLAEIQEWLDGYKIDSSWTKGLSESDNANKMELLDQVKEASDMNDPVLVAFRAAKMKREKELAKPKRKPLYGKQRLKAEDDLWYISQDLKDLYADRGQLLNDMEQEAEAEGGPIADEYGDKLNKIEDEIQKLISNRNKLEVRLAESVVNESVDEAKLSKIHNATKKLRYEDSIPLQNENNENKENNMKKFNIKEWKDKFLNEGKFINFKFNSHKDHNPCCDILEGHLDGDTFITYGIYVKDDGSRKVGDEFMEQYTGSNYKVGSSKRSNSRIYEPSKIPAKYKAAWEELKAKYEKEYK